MSLSLEPSGNCQALAVVKSGVNAGRKVYLIKNCCAFHRLPDCYEVPCCDHCDPDAEIRSKINLASGEFTPLPWDEADHLTTAGASKCGKSSILRDMAIQYLISHPEAQVYVVTFNPVPTFIDEIPGVIRIPYEDIINGSVTSEGLHDSLVIFDDVDETAFLPDDVPVSILKKKATALRDSLFAAGRHENISVYLTSHDALAGKLTTKGNVNSHAIIAFPKYVNRDHLKTILMKKGMLSKEQYESAMAINAPRWLYIRKMGHHPYAIGPREVKLL